MHDITTVLIATGDLVERSQLEQTLASSRYRLIFARDAASLIQAAEVQRPSLVLLAVDFAGPGSGRTLCRHLKGAAETRGSAVILICGRSEEAFPREGDGPPDEVVLRPLYPPELLFRLGSVQRLQRFSNKIVEGSKLDTLTGTFNHGYLLDRLRHEVLRAERYGRSLALVLIDVDGFATINTRRGTAFGDLVLREVARALTSRLRGVDMVARSGPDDFSVVLPETSLLVARPIADRLRAAVEALGAQIADEDARPLQISASLGVAGMPHADAKDVPSLLACARIALARAREAGGNKCVLYQRSLVDAPEPSSKSA